MSGYGLKTLFVAQSLNDIVETYGPNNTILDNCAVYTAFAALDPLTQDKISRLTGTVSEIRMSRSALVDVRRASGGLLVVPRRRGLFEQRQARRAVLPQGAIAGPGVAMGTRRPPRGHPGRDRLRPRRRQPAAAIGVLPAQARRSGWRNSRRRPGAARARRC